MAAGLSCRRYTTSTVPSLAILDDYLSVSRPHFAHIPEDALKVVTFRSPSLHYTPEGQAELVERLKPFEAISTMRERTPFPASLLRELPKLKLLLCSELQPGFPTVSSRVLTCESAV